MSASDRLSAMFSERIVVLDGAMGTQVQPLDLSEADVRGERFAGHGRASHGAAPARRRLSASLQACYGCAESSWRTARRWR